MAINLYSKASVDSLLTPKLSISSLTNAAATTLNATAPTTGQVLSFDGTELKWASAGGSASWGFITGTLSSQTDLNTALGLKAPLASPTFTGTVTIPAGASIDGYLTNSTLSNGATSTLNATVPTTGQALTYDGTDLKWATIGSSPSWLGQRVSIYAGYLYNEDASQYVSTLELSGSATLKAKNVTLTASAGGVLTFADATTQSTAAIGIPTAGATGQVLKKNSGTNYDVAWANASGADVQVFGDASTSGSFTWTKPTGAKWVEILLYGGGGGGGSGARQATTVARGGGGAGGGAGYCHAIMSAGFLSSTETVFVGAGGAGGASIGTDSTNGSNGSNGGTSTFKDYRALGGNLGSAGAAGFVAGGAAIIGSNMFLEASSTGSLGGSGEANTGTSATQRFNNADAPTGGGGGAGAAASNVVNKSGGNGGPITLQGIRCGLSTAISGGTGGSPTAPTAATAGTSATTRYFQGGTGGGGGYYKTAAAAGTGASGGWPGGGAGGGGASDNGNASGAGGAGANGFAVIITYF